MGVAAGSGANQFFERRLVRDQQGGAAQLREPLVTKLAEHAGHGFTRGTDELGNFLVREGDFDADAVFGLLATVGPFQQQTRQFFRNGVREPQRADHLVSALAILAQVIRRAQARVRVILQKLEEVITLDEVQLTWLQRLGGQLVRLPGYGAVQAQYLTRLRDPQDESFAIARSRGQLHPAAAQNVDSARRLSLDEQHRALRKRAGVLDPVEFLERGFGEIAKKTGMTELANQATFRNLQPVRCAHSGPLLRGDLNIPLASGKGRTYRKIAV